MKYIFVSLLFLSVFVYSCQKEPEIDPDKVVEIDIISPADSSYYNSGETLITNVSFTNNDTIRNVWVSVRQVGTTDTIYKFSADVNTPESYTHTNNIPLGVTTLKEYKMTAYHYGAGGTDDNFVIEVSYFTVRP